MSNCLSLAVAAVVLLVLSTCTFGSVASTVCRQTGYEVAHLYSGKVRGRRQRCSISFKMDKQNTEIREVIEYLGIPYAAPPIGKLRFKVKTYTSYRRCMEHRMISIRVEVTENMALAISLDVVFVYTHHSTCNHSDSKTSTWTSFVFTGDDKTREVEPWLLTRDALAFGSRCIQRWSGQGRDQGYSDQLTKPNHTVAAGMSEDCLFANVYSPELKVGVKYPIMVFIHGGSYVYGTGNRYNGTALAYKGAVVVTFNYRLGALGFLTSGDERLPGNYGLYDQLQVLLWVRRNGALFGGDTSAVTIFGSSAGAASVGILFLSPLAKGLFHRVIAQSGVANAMWASHQDRRSYRNQVRHLANATFCLRHSFEECMRCIMTKDAAFFEEDKLCKRMNCKLIDPVFKPVVDGNLIVADIKNMMKNGNFPRDVPLMTGTVKTEFGRNTKKNLEGMPAGLDSYLKENYSPMSRHLIAYEYSTWSSKQAQNHLQFTDENYDRAETLSDLGLVAPTGQFAQSLVGVSGRVPSVFMYYLERYDESYHSLDLNDVFGACYLGNNVTFDELGQSRIYKDRDFDRSEQIMRMWINFAKLGKPFLNDNIWPKVTKEHLNFLSFRTTEKKTILNVKRDYYAKKAYFWGRLLITSDKPSIHEETTGRIARSEEEMHSTSRGQDGYITLATLAMICLVGSLVISAFWNITLWKRTRRYNLDYDHRIYI